MRVFEGAGTKNTRKINDIAKKGGVMFWNDANTKSVTKSMLYWKKSGACSVGSEHEKCFAINNLVKNLRRCTDDFGGRYSPKREPAQISDLKIICKINP